MPVILSHPENRQWNAEPNHCVVGANREYPQLLWQRTLAAVICGRVFPAAESRGSMPDSSSAIMEGAKVTLANTCTTEKRAMNTSAEGGYRFARLIAGTSVEKPSSMDYTRDQIPVEVAGRCRHRRGYAGPDMAQSVVVERPCPFFKWRMRPCEASTGTCRRRTPAE